MARYKTKGPTWTPEEQTHWDDEQKAWAKAMSGTEFVFLIPTTATLWGLYDSLPIHVDESEAKAPVSAVGGKRQPKKKTKAQITAALAKARKATDERKKREAAGTLTTEDYATIKAETRIGVAMAAGEHAAAMKTLEVCSVSPVLVVKPKPEHPGGEFCLMEFPPEWVVDVDQQLNRLGGFGIPAGKKSGDSGGTPKG